MKSLYQLLGFDPSRMSVKEEIIGGITTFLTMSYILAVQPALLGKVGMDAGAVFTSTILSSVVATVFMAVYAKLPFALAPSMGENTFFVFTIVLGLGYSWQFALTAVFVEGLLFILMTLTGLRNMIVEAMPKKLRLAITPGIGLFITFLGMQNAGIVVSDESTIVSLGDFGDPSVLVACFGVIFTTVLLVRKVTGALLWGILVTALLGVPLGVTHFTSFTSVPPSISPVFFKIEWCNIFSIDMLICIITLLFMDMFNTIGTLIGVGYKSGFVDKEGTMPRMNKALMADAVGTTAGALLGSSTISTYVESASGVNAGGRCGMTAMVTAVCFLLSLFLAPLFLAIPAAATAPVLILVGVMMIGNITSMDFENYLVAIPCFICIVVMPFAFSIADGIILGVISWVVLHLLSGNAKGLSWGTVILALLFMVKYAL